MRLFNANQNRGVSFCRFGRENVSTAPLLACVAWGLSPPPPTPPPFSHERTIASCSLICHFFFLFLQQPMYRSLQRSSSSRREYLDHLTFCARAWRQTGEDAEPPWLAHTCARTQRPEQREKKDNTFKAAQEPVFLGWGLPFLSIAPLFRFSVLSSHHFFIYIHFYIYTYMCISISIWTCRVWVRDALASALGQRHSNTLRHDTPAQPPPPHLPYIPRSSLRQVPEFHFVHYPAFQPRSPFPIPLFSIPGAQRFTSSANLI